MALMIRKDKKRKKKDIDTIFIYTLWNRFSNDFVAQSDFRKISVIKSWSVVTILILKVRFSGFKKSTKLETFPKYFILVTYELNFDSNRG